VGAVEGWETKTLRQLAIINYGRSPANILKDDGPYPVVGTGGNERLGNDYLYDGDSIVLGRKGTIDRVYFATGRFWTIDTAYYLSDFHESVPRWLYHALQSIDFRQMNEATGVPSLSRDRLYKIEIKTPPRPEQAKIAEILSTVDRAIEQTEALIAKQQCIKTGLMQDLLTRGIDEHGNLRSEETHKFKDSPLGRIPVEWGVQQLSRTCSLITDGKHGDCQDQEGSGYFFVSAKDIIEGAIDYSEARQIVRSDFLETHRRTNLEAGDVVMSNAGTIGRTAIAADSPMTSMTTFQKSVAVIKPQRKDVNSAYLASYFIQHLKTLEELARGSSQKNLLLGDLCRLPVALPSLEEQGRVVHLPGRLQEHLTRNAHALSKLRSLKSALMQDLLSGRKRVSGLLADREDGVR
jgi:type I restriction enzyme, S subunit